MQPLPPTQSLFPKRALSGTEILFRAVCALGWTVEHNLPILRHATESVLGSGPLFWIAFVEDEIIGRFHPTCDDASTWLRDLRKLARDASKRPDIRKQRKISSWLRKLSMDLRLSQAVAINQNFDVLHRLGFDLSHEMIANTEWSPDSAREKWTLKTPVTFAFAHGDEGSFKPVTTRGSSIDTCRIDLKVHLGKSFARQHSILYYLTLAYQFMHEYISHVLPEWQSGDPLEEEYLLAAMFLYYKSNGPDDGICVLLVGEADAKKGGEQRSRREFIKYSLAPRIGEARLSLRLLELALMNETRMSFTDKLAFLGLLNKVPPDNPKLRAVIWNLLKTQEIHVIYEKLKPTLRDGNPSLKILECG